MKVLEKPRSYLFAHPEADIPAEQGARYEALIERRRRGEPVAYLTGRRAFWTLDLKVTPDTLIPRPDTELLVELALALPEVPAHARVADLGTGSGAIALAVASERLHWHIDAVDTSAAALTVAQENAATYQINNISFVLGNWCYGLTDRYDLILSNPPYIAEQDPHLDEGDLRYEPRTALMAMEQGLSDIRTIAAQSSQRLKSGGWLLLEHGFEQGEAVREILRCDGYQEVATRQDLSGHERVTMGRWRC